MEEEHHILTMEEDMMVIGKMINLKETVLLNLVMEQDMKEIGKITDLTEKELYI